MAITNFVPSVWSETLLKSLDKEYVAVMNCNREFEGDIRNVGDSVKINSIGPVTIFDYTRNTDMTSPETLSGSSVTLEINQAKAFNFQIDDVDRVQAKPKLMQAAMREAAGGLADKADAYVFSLYTEASADNTITKAGVAYTDMLDLLIEAREKLLSNNVNSNTDTVLEVSPSVAALLLKAKLVEATDNSEAMANGYLGTLIGFDIYVSNNVAVADGYHKCFARTRRAIAFAEQLSAVEAFRPEKRFADAVKGLHLYGAKVVCPDELVLLNLSI